MKLSLNFVTLSLLLGLQQSLCQICPWPGGRGVRRDGDYALRSHVLAPEFPPGTKIEFKCNDGQQLVQPEPLACQPNGEWKNAWLGCRPETQTVVSKECKKTCDMPRPPSNGFIVGMARKVYHDNAAVNFGCNPGLYMVGSATIKCANGSWSEAIPTCQETSPYANINNFCPLLSYGVEQLGKAANLQEAAYIMSSVPNFIVGTKISFSCAHGMRLRGVNNINCLKTGRWSGDIPSCVHEAPLSCPVPPPAAPARGMIVGGASITRRVFLPGSYVEYRCLPGYLRVGYDRVFCRRDGTWSANTVLMQCQLRTTKAPLTTTTKPTCPPLETPATRMSRPQLRMKVVGQENAPAGAHFNKPLVEGTQYTFECPAQHRMVSGDSRMVCLQGRWQGEIPQCEPIPTTTPVPQCPPIQDVISKAGPRNYLLNNQFKQQTSNGRFLRPGEPGSMYEFICPKTHSLVGDRRVICVDGQWVGEVPDCIAIPTTPDPCSLIPNPGPNMILADKYNRTAIYACQRGFTMTGQGMATCDGGKWSFKGGKAPICRKVQTPCKPPPQDMYNYKRQFYDDVEVRQSVWICLDTQIDTSLTSGNRMNSRNSVSSTAFENAFQASSSINVNMQQGRY